MLCTNLKLPRHVCGRVVSRGESHTESLAGTHRYHPVPQLPGCTRLSQIASVFVMRYGASILTTNLPRVSRNNNNKSSAFPPFFLKHRYPQMRYNFHSPFKACSTLRKHMLCSLEHDGWRPMDLLPRAGFMRKLWTSVALRHQKS